MKKARFLHHQITAILEAMRQSKTRYFQWEDEGGNDINLTLYPSKKEAYYSIINSGLFEKEGNDLVFVDREDSVGILTKSGEILYFLEGDSIPVKQFPKAKDIDGVIWGHANGYDFWPLDKVHLIVDENDKDLKNIRVDFEPTLYDGEREIDFSELKDDYSH